MAEKKKSRTEKNTVPQVASASVEGVSLPIEMRFPEGMNGLYSNHMLVQLTATECTLSFFEVKSPMVFGTPEERAEQAKKIESVRADCVARIIVASGFLPQVITILQDTWTKHVTEITANPEIARFLKSTGHDLTVSK